MWRPDGCGAAGHMWVGLTDQMRGHTLVPFSHPGVDLGDPLWHRSPLVFYFVSTSLVSWTNWQTLSSFLAFQCNPGSGVKITHQETNYATSPRPNVGTLQSWCTTLEIRANPFHVWWIVIVVIGNLIMMKVQQPFFSSKYLTLVCDFYHLMWKFQGYIAPIQTKGSISRVASVQGWHIDSVTELEGDIRTVSLYNLCAELW